MNPQHVLLSFTPVSCGSSVAVDAASYQQFHRALGVAAAVRSTARSGRCVRGHHLQGTLGDSRLPINQSLQFCQEGIRQSPCSPRGVTTWSSCLASCLPLHLVQILPRIDPHASVSIALSAVAVSGGWHRIDGLTIRSVAEAPTVVWSSGFSKAPPVHVQDS